MKHDQCAHPRTPAGRAACRKVGGVTPAKPPQIVQERAARATRSTPRSRAEHAAGATSRRAVGIPEPIRYVAKLAKERGYAVVSRAEGTNVRVTITSDHGDLILWWKSATPTGIADVQWRAATTSVTRRIMTVGMGVDLLTTGKVPG